MLRGCLAALLLLGLLVGAYFWWLDQVFEMPGSLIGAGVVGFIVFCCIGAIQNAGRAYKDWSLASLAKHDVRPTGGQMIAVSGTIHPLHEPLVAPFSGQECVICEYDLASQHRPVKKSDGKPNGSDYCGFLMTPSVIRSRLGDVRLLGYPMLEGFEESRCVGYDSARNAEQFLTSRQFEDRTGLKMVTLFNVFGQVWSDDDGHVEKNIKIGNVEPAELFDRQLQTDMAKYSAWERDNPEQARKFSGSYELDDEEEDDLDEEDEQTFESKGFTSTVPIMTETRVRPGEPVCAFGIFDEFKMGLCPPRGSTKANRLLRGRLRRSRRVRASRSSATSWAESWSF
jgi:hypothetical protein